MPKVIIHKDGQVFQDEVQDNTNLVVRAGIRKFPYPYLRYGCGMGKCAKCTCRIISGAENLPEPNWKEKKMLGERLAQGLRLACQLWLHHDVELTQDGVSPPASTQAVLQAAGDSMYVILTSKPGQFRTEPVDGVRPVEAYDYIAAGRLRARFVIAELAQETKIKVVDEALPPVVNHVPSKFLERFDSVEEARAAYLSRVADLAARGFLDASAG